MGGGLLGGNESGLGGTQLRVVQTMEEDHPVLQGVIIQSYIMGYNIEYMYYFNYLKEMRTPSPSLKEMGAPSSSLKKMGSPSVDESWRLLVMPSSIVCLFAMKSRN